MLAKIEARQRRRPASERKLGWGRHYASVDTSFPWPEDGELRFEADFDERYLVERLSAIGWRVEIEPPVSLKHKVARALRRIGVWQHYERMKERLRTRPGRAPARR